MRDVVRGYLKAAAELTTGAAAGLRRRAEDLAAVAVSRPEELPAHLQGVAAEALAAGVQNGELLVGLVRSEVEKAWHRVGDGVVQLGVVLELLERQIRQLQGDSEQGPVAEERPEREPTQVRPVRVPVDDESAGAVGADDAEAAARRRSAVPGMRKRAAGTSPAASAPEGRTGPAAGPATQGEDDSAPQSAPRKRAQSGARVAKAAPDAAKPAPRTGTPAQPEPEAPAPGQKAPAASRKGSSGGRAGKGRAAAVPEAESARAGEGPASSAAPAAPARPARKRAEAGGQAKTDGGSERGQGARGTKAVPGGASRQRAGVAEGGGPTADVPSVGSAAAGKQARSARSAQGGAQRAPATEPGDGGAGSAAEAPSAGPAAARKRAAQSARAKKAAPGGAGPAAAPGEAVEGTTGTGDERTSGAGENG